MLKILNLFTQHISFTHYKVIKFYSIFNKKVVKNMAKILKFVYAMILFIFLFLFGKSVDGKLLFYTF